MSVDVSQVLKLAADLKRQADGRTGVTRKAKNIVSKVAHGIEATAKSLVRVDTGATKNSIGADISPDGLHAEVGPTTSYSPYLEWGTSRMGPYPFMGPALDQWAPQFEAAVEQLGDLDL